MKVLEENEQKKEELQRLRRVIKEEVFDAYDWGGRALDFWKACADEDIDLELGPHACDVCEALFDTTRGGEEWLFYTSGCKIEVVQDNCFRCQYCVENNYRCESDLFSESD